MSSKHEIVLLSEPAMLICGIISPPGDAGRMLGEEGGLGDGVLEGEGVERLLKKEGGRRNRDDSLLSGVGVDTGVGERIDSRMLEAKSGVG